MRKVFKRKNGDAVLDGLSILVIVFIFGFISIMSYKAFTDIEPDVTSMILEDNNSAVNESLASVNSVKNDFPGVFDGALVVILVGLWIFSLVSAYFIDTNPLFMILSVVLLVFVLIVAAIIGNVGEELLDESDISPTAVHFPVTSWVINHLLIVVLVIVFSVVFVLYGKSRGVL